MTTKIMSSLTQDELSVYISNQLNCFFPDKFVVHPSLLVKNVAVALDRLNYCFSKVINHRYNNGNNSIYNHLYSDHNIVFYWFLSNTIYKNTNDENLASKLYYLNKSLHGFDCMYDTNLPDIFLIFHGVGTMLGKAEYKDFFIAMQGCTVGSHKNSYPKMGKGVSLTANSSIIGDCTIGHRCSVSSGTQIFQKNMSNDEVAFINPTTGILECKQSNKSYGAQFFNEDFNNL